MCQNAPRLLLISVGICLFAVVSELTIRPIPLALAAAEAGIVQETSTLPGSTRPTPRKMAAPVSDSGQSKQSTASMQRLMSQMPVLRQLVTPSSPPPPSLSPVIGVSSKKFSFSVQQGNTTPPAQMLTVSNRGGGVLNWNATTNAAWLILSPASGTGTGTVTINPTMESLAVGTHTGVITISATGASSISVPVTFTLTAAPVPPAIGASPTTLSFTAQHGGSNPAAQTLRISNTGSGTLTWTTSDNAPWLTLSPASGTGNGTVTISPTIGSLAVGTHTGVITIKATGAQSVSVPITFTVTPAPTSISVTPSSLTYTGVSGGSNPSNQSVTVTANGNWTARADAAWLTLSPSSGSGNGTITASVDLENVSTKTNTATITVTGGTTTKTVRVTLTLSAASLSLSSNSLTFTATQGAANPAGKTIAVLSNGAWTAKEDVTWLSLSQTSGTSNGTITAIVNTSKAVQGENQATVTVTSGGITRTATITLTLNAPSSSSATLTWKANVEKDLGGYKVYRATTSGAYGAPIAILRGNVTTYQATGLQFGTTYFFVVTAFDIAGNESGYSNEVSKSIF